VLVATERDDKRRAAWRQDAQRLDARQFVIVDETSTTISLVRGYAWAPTNERARGAVPRNHGTPTTLVASLTPAGLGPAMTLPGALDTAAFEVYIRDVLGPTLQPGQIVVLDNLSAHKADVVREEIEHRHCQLLYLPPYSPDFSPIELAFAKLKAFLRQVAARTQDDLDEAIRRALDLLSPEETRAFFKHCGYHLPAES
jgi:transposase